jgi:serine/threonine-protein kinase ATR
MKSVALSPVVIMYLYCMTADIQGGKHRKHMPLDDKAWWTYLPDALLYYAKGLHKGHRRLFHALPRLLTLWFEFGILFRGDVLASNKSVKAVHARTMGIIRGCLKDLPTYQWLTALSQLVSRICHPNEEVVRLVKHIITTLLQAYPQQALWTMAAVSKSTVAARREAAAEIIQQAKNEARRDTDRVLFNQFALLIEQMIKLSFYPGQPKSRTVNIQAEFSALKRMMPVGVVMPLQKALTVTLPPDGLSNVKYDPFPVGDYTTISGIMDDVEILASLQRPKKVVLLGSDGMEHPFLCKPKDDLRKDARMMEFTSMINRLLSKDPKSRRRKLYIRTFAVIPLTEDCGMIEWVLHTRGLRHILQDIYVADGKFDRQKTNPLIKRLYDQEGAQGEAEVFRKKILPMFPPLFHRWFLNTFPEPAAWFGARMAYAHTTAVWSMVGHIVGLGDRHGENILFDSTTGDCVHVDFSCLFDKGLSLEKPEVVPFRLTQNMIDGLGITGYEGVFLRVCEISLSILRAHRETLLSVLETFIHDPLVEWTKSHKSSGVEVQNPHAQRAIANIEARLRGVVVGVGAAPSLPLSVEGQAHRLISEAVSHTNLAKMYIWWMAWF